MSLEVRVGDLHKEVEGYPGPVHRMPVCCQVMRGEMTKADELVTGPPKGNGGVGRDPLPLAEEQLKRAPGPLRGLPPLPGQGQAVSRLPYSSWTRARET